MARKSVLEKHEEYEAIERYISLSEPEVDVLSHELIDLVKTRNVRGETNYKRFEHKNAFDVKDNIVSIASLGASHSRQMILPGCCKQYGRRRPPLPRPRKTRAGSVCCIFPRPKRLAGHDDEGCRKNCEYTLGFEKVGKSVGTCITWPRSYHSRSRDRKRLARHTKGIGAMDPG